jgi:formiminoglutamase
MLHHWLKPVQNKVEVTENQLGSRISIYLEEVPDLSNIKTVFIGLDDSAETIRQFLYAYATIGEGVLPIADLGNIRKATNDFIIPLLYELLQLGITPILLSSSEDAIMGQFQAYQTAEQKVNVAIVDEKIRLSLTGKEKMYLNHILEEDGKNRLLHVSVVGAQGHLTDADVLTYFEMKHYDAVRLGQARAQPEEIEPLIRDANLMLFHLSALKQAEAPAQIPFSPSGFFSEEACRLVRYAGMSDKLNSIGFYGYDLKKDNHFQTAQVIAQMIWYFWEGFLNRKNDFPISNDDLVEYIIDYKINSYQITFWKSNKSGRWWMQVPAAKINDIQQHQLVPCSYADYQAACAEELPERLLYALQRYL